MTATPVIVDQAVAHHARLDAQLVAAVKGVRMLESIVWPAQAQEEFLAAWRVGRIRLPKIEYRQDRFDPGARSLEAVSRSADPTTRSAAI